MPAHLKSRSGYRSAAARARDSKLNSKYTLYGFGAVGITTTVLWQYLTHGEERPVGQRGLTVTPMVGPTTGVTLSLTF